jgi:hypothetical protein
MKFQRFIPYRFFLCCIFLITGLFFVGCKKEPAFPDGPGNTTNPPSDAVEYMQFQLSSANQLEIVRESTSHYMLTTTGTDPYVSVNPLSSVNPTGKVVFTFEYQSTNAISSIQFFFGSPVTEERSMKSNALPSASGWTVHSVDLADYIAKFSWGKAGDFLRIDFGNQPGVAIQIRNMQLRERTAEEVALAKAREEQLASDNLLESALAKYLSANFSSQVTEVLAKPTTISIKGFFSGEGNFSLCEITPYEQFTQNPKFQQGIALSNPSFSVEVDRFTERDGFTYDRALSKWVVVKTGAAAAEMVSHARYADQISANQELPAQKPTGRKGLGGFAVSRGFLSDLDDLNITSVTVNIAFTELMYLGPWPDAILHNYGGKVYSFSKSRVEALDETIKIAYSKNIVVAAIILVQKASQCADPEIGKLLQHPGYTDEGIFTMPNMTTPESFNCYAAALDFLASRYCRSDNAFGRIHHWIMHNEVDAGLTWTNMGVKPVTVYMDTYIKSMRLCYNIARKYDASAEVLASFTHSWAEACAPDYYATKNMLKILQNYIRVEGDFQWGLACHPYPQDLMDPKTWNDSKATFSMNSPLVTFKNLEVLDAWIKRTENQYKGSIKRTLWLSENGTNSPTYSETDLKEQAAGFAYAWKKMKKLDGIDAFQWHNWIDNRLEDGLRIGLRRFPDDTADPGGRKPVWFVYQAAGTAQEDAVFDLFKPVIGISNWDEVCYSGTIQ